VAESNFLKEKAVIRKKVFYEPKNRNNRMIRGSSKSKLIKELKQLDSRYKTNIEDLKELRCLIVQFNQLKDPVNKSVRERFGN